MTGIWLTGIWRTLAVRQWAEPGSFSRKHSGAETWRALLHGSPVLDRQPDPPSLRGLPSFALRNGANPGDPVGLMQAARAECNGRGTENGHFEMKPTLRVATCPGHRSPRLVCLAVADGWPVPHREIIKG